MFLAVVLASVLFGEIVVRVLYPRFDVSGQVTFRTLEDGTPLAKIGARQRLFKSTGDYDVGVTIGPLGFREFKPVSTADSQSIFVVGDSFAFGWGVEESDRFSNKLEILLGRKVFNIAILTDIRGYAKLVRHAERSGAQVTAVVVGLCMENDLMEYEQESGHGSETDQDDGAEGLSLSDIKEILGRNSSLYFFAVSLVHRNAFLRGLAVKLGLIMPNGADLGSWPAARGAIESSVRELTKSLQGRRFVALIIPSRALWLGDAETRRHAAVVHEAFLEVLRKRQIDFVDMRPDFEAGGDPLKHHFKHDGHWNSLGHSLAGRKLAEHIARHNF